MPLNLTVEQLQAAHLKFRILAEGLRTSENALNLLINSKQPLRTRSGVSGGLDLDLGYNVYVNAPVNEPFVRDSSLQLDIRDGNFIVLSRNGSAYEKVKPLPEPAYYKEKSPDGRTDLMRIGQMCSGDRFCYGMTGRGCFFWGKDKRCKYCSIGAKDNPDLTRKQATDFLHTFERALGDPRLPARHILIGGGTPKGEDMGAKLAAELTREIKKRWKVSVYVMIAAPLHNSYLDELLDSGADEIGINLEFWSDDSWREFIPGKDKIIGKQRYLDALEYCSRKLGPTGTRSIIIAGLEAEEYTIRAVQEVSARGAMPIISPFRPFADTDLRARRGFSAERYWSLYIEAEEIARSFGLPLGPTCIHCQNNILALPFGPQYRYY